MKLWGFVTGGQFLDQQSHSQLSTNYEDLAVKVEIINVAFSLSMSFAQFYWINYVVSQ
jgi:hypothetical protein